jgi:exonuclease III
VRILAWNLLHGGGRRITGLAEAIVRHDADLCVLAESRRGRDRELLLLLEPHGYGNHVSTPVAERRNGVLVASRLRLAASPAPAGELYAQRWLTLQVDGIELVACHVPPKISIGVERKQAFWDTLLGYARAHLADPAMIVGDLNTGAPYRDEHRATLYAADRFEELSRLGWVDAWRRFHGPTQKEWSWAYPRRPGYGYRLDHAFCAPRLADGLRSCRYSHDERHARLSDHSILLVDVEPPGGSS